MRLVHGYLSFCELRLYNIDLFFTAVSYNRDLMKSGRATATQNAYIPTSGSTANWKSEHDAKYTPIEFAHDTAQRYDAYMIAIVKVLPRVSLLLSRNDLIEIIILCTPQQSTT